MLSRIQKLRDLLAQQALDAMLVVSAPNRQYLSGFSGSSATLLLTRQSNILVTDFRYQEQAAKETTGYAIFITSPQRDVGDLLLDTIHAQGLRRIGFESDRMTVAELFALQHTWETVELVPCPGVIETLRAVKDAQEVAAIRYAQSVADHAFTKILQFMKPGIREVDIAAELCYDMAKYGCTLSFSTIVASGENGSMPHAQPTMRKIACGEFVTMDYGCCYQGYCSDMTRTVAVGTPTAEMRQVYAIVLEAQQRALDAIHAGVTGNAVDAVARDYIADCGYGDCFGHGLGHSLGLEIHEEPRFSPSCPAEIPAGTCISVEPGIYIPGKFGVRIEDIVCVTENGYENLVTSPKELIIL